MFARRRRKRFRFFLWNETCPKHTTRFSRFDDIRAQCTCAPARNSIEPTTRACGTSKCSCTFREIGAHAESNLPCALRLTRKKVTEESKHKINHDKLDFNESSVMDGMAGMPSYKLRAVFSHFHFYFSPPHPTSCRLFYLHENFSEVDQRVA